jgi:hypothetical protein
VGVPRRSSLASSISSCTSSALCISSIATAVGSASSMDAPSDRAAAMHRLERIILPPRCG